MASSKDTRKKKINYTNSKETAQKQQSGFSPTSINLPKGMPLFNFKKEGLYRIDIMPFVVGKGNPMADEGMVHWERTYFTHGAVGPDNRQYACLWKNFKKKCPVCDHAAKLRREGGDSSLIEALEKTKKRQIFCIIDLDEKDKGLQILEGSYYNGLGELIDNKIDATEEDSSYRDFFHLDNGMRLIIKSKSASFQGRSYFQVANVEMEPRKVQYDESKLEEIPCLDELPKELSYNELKEILEGGETGEDDSDKDDDKGSDSEWEKGQTVSFEYKGKSLTGVIAKVDDDKELAIVLVGDKKHTVDFKDLEVVEVAGSDDDSENDKDETLPPKKRGTQARKPDPEDDEDEDDDSETEDDEEADDDDSEEEEPAPKKRGRPAGKKPVDEDEDDDSDDEDEDDEPPVKKGGKKPAVDEDEMKMKIPPH